MALPSLVARRRVVLTAIERRLPDPHSLTSAGREAVRDRGLRLRLSAPGLVAARRSGLQMASQRLGGAIPWALSFAAEPRRAGDRTGVGSSVAIGSARGARASRRARAEAGRGVAAGVAAAGLCPGDNAGWSAGDHRGFSQTRRPATATIRRWRGGCRGPERSSAAGGESAAPRARPAAAGRRWISRIPSRHHCIGSVERGGNAIEAGGDRWPLMAVGQDIEFIVLDGLDNAAPDCFRSQNAGRESRLHGPPVRGAGSCRRSARDRSRQNRRSRCRRRRDRGSTHRCQCRPAPVPAPRIAQARRIWSSRRPPDCARCARTGWEPDPVLTTWPGSPWARIIGTKVRIPLITPWTFTPITHFRNSPG